MGAIIRESLVNLLEAVKWQVATNQSNEGTPQQHKVQAVANSL